MALDAEAKFEGVEAAGPHDDLALGRLDPGGGGRVRGAGLLDKVLTAFEEGGMDVTVIYDDVPADDVVIQKAYVKDAADA